MHTITAVFRCLATAFVWFVAIVWILDVIGVNLGPLIAGAGIVGVALGFGTQTMVRDFIAGFFLVVEDQFGVGDIVDLGGEAKGTVEAGHPALDPAARRRRQRLARAQRAAHAGRPTRARSGRGR